MKSLDIDQIRDLAGMFSSIQANLNDADETNRKYDLSYERLQSALVQIQKNPFDPAVSKKLQNAITAYQTAARVTLIKLKDTFAKAKRGQIKLRSNHELERIADELSRQSGTDVAP